MSNNSLLPEDQSDSLGKEEQISLLRQTQEKLVKIIDAIQNIAASTYWKTLNDEIFSDLLASLQRRLVKEDDQKEVNRLQGQIIWAQKFSSFQSLGEVYRKELGRITHQLEELNGKNE